MEKNKLSPSNAPCLLGIALILIGVSLQAQDLKSLFNSATSSPAVDALSSSQVASGLKEALGNGVASAIKGLGKPGGFLDDLAVRIPLPANIQKGEKALRALGQGPAVDNFEASMNHAAEQAVPEAADVLGDSIKQMSLADAKAILTGSNTAATAYFKRTSQPALQAKFLPIVKKATDSVGVTKSYKEITSKISGGSLGGLGGFGHFAPSADSFDIDAYVTQKALDGLFVKIADEEKKIRSNPAARTTGLLQQVFGAVGK